MKFIAIKKIYKKIYRTDEDVHIQQSHKKRVRKFLHSFRI